LHYALSGGTTPNARAAIHAVDATSSPRNCPRGVVCPKERE
jgi:hypothetical protein